MQIIIKTIGFFFYKGPLKSFLINSFENKGTLVGMLLNSGKDTQDSINITKNYENEFKKDFDNFIKNRVIEISLE